MTMLVLERPSERATQIRQAVRQEFVEVHDIRAMRRSLVARPRPWREFQVGDQVVCKGRGMRHGHARWHGRAVVLALWSWIPGDINCSRCHRNSCECPRSQRGWRMT